MKLKPYTKLTIREILSSKARFISILIIILLGVAFYSGIKSSGPDMSKAINHLFNEYHLMDSKVVSNFGLDDDDVDVLRNDDRILDFYATHSIDVNLTNASNVVRFMEYDKESNINDFIIVEGRLPENSGEIAIDEEALKLNKDIQIGQEYTIETDDETMKNFKQTTFTVVGMVRSPMYIEKGSRGITSVGKGSIDYFAVLNRSDLSMDAYTELYIRFKNVQGLDGYSDEYQDVMDENSEYLENLFAARKEERAEELKAALQKQWSQSTANMNQLSQSSVDKRAEGMMDVDQLAYYVSDRTDNPGYLGYKDSIHSLDSIASVLPVFFFLLAVMICLTTMTRMVEENRTEIGTLKALGYGNFEIAKKYIIYASLASILGAVLGILIGASILPGIISNAHESLYSLPKVSIVYYPSYIVQSLFISILCTVGASLFVLRVELRNKPANLMKVKAPKVGKKILLERVTPIWRRFNFNYKVTFRNIFRYKQRMLMTIFGISGCMALLVTGFGLKDSNVGMVDRQFGQLWNYEAMVILDDDSTEEMKEYDNTLNRLSGYEDKLDLHQESVVFSKEDMNNQEATLYVPQSTDHLDDFIILGNRESGDKYKLSDDGVVITEKLAKLLDVSVGDTVSMTDDDNHTYDIRIDAIAENYVKHYIYMSPTYYEKVLEKKPVYQTQLLNFDRDLADEDEISSKLMNHENVINVTLTSNMQEASEDSVANMNLVMIVIIISAGCLAFVVLYNLNNINVSERIRELSTIKVLGFYDNEVTMYIVRENVILTLLGIVTGSFLGNLLHAFIIYTAETDTMMMYPDVSILSHILSAAITIFFSTIVMMIMHAKLKKVNMIDALKSNE
ncbi:ABC transporter permease [Paenibacillus sp. J45TS6]|uniref:ABC transporter permease n=2 Tax=unclassified Paenibacillus TaxID=185978 RepID=UPI001B2ECDC4|nr:ABC transporter permease [Paenibacillus sp. J45TS6]GIP46308.1 ABC transporter permease [Paenibacillus sp. J45TS6]